ncbi:MAG: DUF4198 domain-containing protein [Janthinobacterium lividum]
MRRLLPCLLLATTVALAHEFWLQPGSFRVAAGQAVPVRLLVGGNFTGEAWPRPTRKVLRFVCLGAFGPADSTDLRPALLTDSVAPVLRCAGPGTQTVLLTSRPSFSELDPEKFTAYLREEGLDLALRRREELGQTKTKPGREAYRRCAKTLLLASPGTAARALNPKADTLFRQPLGLPLELVAEQNPYRLKAGAALTVRVLRFGQPVTGALVQVWEAGAAPGQGHFSTRTNREGRVLLRLPGAGPYLLATVQMETAPPALVSRADWLSTWASLTFGGPAALLKAH